jgi:putative transposase
VDTIEEAAFDTVALDAPDFLRQIVARARQRLLEAEMTAHLGAARSERSVARHGDRTGDTPRPLHTRVGTLPWRVPDDRESLCSTQLVARSQRSEQARGFALLELSSEGVSTRQVAEVISALGGTTCTRGGRVRSRPAAPPPSSIDARDEHVRATGAVVSQGVRSVSASRADGRRAVLAVAVADPERAWLRPRRGTAASSSAGWRGCGW